MAEQPTTDRVERRERIDYVVIEFPQARLTGSGFARLIELANAGQILVLDVEFIARRADGEVMPMAAHDLGTIDGVDMSYFDGAVSNLLSAEDVQDIGVGLAMGSLAVIVVYQELSMRSAIDAWQSEGAVVLEEGPADVEALTAAVAAGTKA